VRLFFAPACPPPQTQNRLTADRNTIDPKTKDIAKKAKVSLFDTPFATHKLCRAEIADIPTGCRVSLAISATLVFLSHSEGRYPSYLIIS
jgi:hypothetical protein